jgi:hypothetical protein
MNAHIDSDAEAFLTAAKSLLPFLLRLGRGAAFSISAYLLLSLQSHFDFNFNQLAAAIFFLALSNRTVLLTEMLLFVIAVSIFIPTSLTQAAIGWLS